MKDSVLASRRYHPPNNVSPKGAGREIKEGLTALQKRIPSKYFYDARGSRLFQKICRQPEYYLTRTEASILERIAPEFIKTVANKDLVELGCGSEKKILILLGAADKNTRAGMRYIPMDICETAVRESSLNLRTKYPELRVHELIADFTSQMDLVPAERSKVLCFLGSTIGNFSVDQSFLFLKNIAENMNGNDRLLIGFDMLKSPRILHAAYNDAAGITAEFNRNILNVINHKLNGNFEPRLFDHLAFFNAGESRIEMHLKANRDCMVTLKSVDLQVAFKKADTIHTEDSHKFSPARIEALARRSGLIIYDSYTDSSKWFSLVVMGRGRC
ncbi:MAG: L-histidine N(alpha)-methyltransferase [Deltaproteobacteria bacterium]|jgi:L-histidine N-alpha-methyltransferase